MWKRTKSSTELTIDSKETKSEDLINDNFKGISKEAHKAAIEIIKKIEVAENRIAKAREAGTEASPARRLPFLPLPRRSLSKTKHLDMTMKNLEAISSLFEIQKTYIELINQSNKFGQEVNIALATYVEESYSSQMGSIKKLSNESEMAIGSLVEHANMVSEIQERSSKQILISFIVSGVSLLIAAVSLILVFTS